jgi:hypothetical protein
MTLGKPAGESGICRLQVPGNAGQRTDLQHGAAPHPIPQFRRIQVPVDALGNIKWTAQNIVGCNPKNAVIC